MNTKDHLLKLKHLTMKGSKQINDVRYIELFVVRYYFDCSTNSPESLERRHGGEAHTRQVRLILVVQGEVGRAAQWVLGAAGKVLVDHTQTLRNVFVALLDNAIPDIKNCYRIRSIYIRGCTKILQVNKQHLYDTIYNRTWNICSLRLRTSSNCAVACLTRSR